MSEHLSGLSLAELYNELVLPEAPPPVSMWPQTVGWLWLTMAVLVLVVLASWRWTTWRRKTAYRRAALVSLRSAGEDPAAIAEVLKRTALAGFPRDDVASLYGAQWLSFLDQSGGNRKFAGSEAGRVLVSAPYAPQRPNGDLAAMAEEWVRTHRNSGRET